MEMFLVEMKVEGPLTRMQKLILRASAILAVGLEDMEAQAAGRKEFDAPEFGLYVIGMEDLRDNLRMLGAEGRHIKRGPNGLRQKMDPKLS